MDFNNHAVYFTTFTIEAWVPVFDDYPECKIIICKSLKFLFDNTEIIVYGFVIMPDHMHLLWEIMNKEEVTTLINRFKKFTGYNIKQYLVENEELYLSHFVSDRKDREYKIWKLKTSSTRLKHPKIFVQKLNYIHQNPTKGNYQLVELPEEYKYSSALSYMQGKSLFPFLTIQDME